MSNPTTNFLVGGIDLSSIFQPYSGGTQANITGYQVNSVDFNTIFNPYIGGIKANTTGYQVNNIDLNNIFAPYNNNLIQRVSDTSFNGEVGFSNIFSSNNTNQYIYASCLGKNYASQPDLYTTILKSSDYGVSWSQLYPDNNSTNTNFGWESVASDSTGSIVIACNSDTQKIWKSTNYGSSWIDLNVTQQPWVRLCIDTNINIYAIASTSLYVFNSNGNLQYTTTNINLYLNNITCSNSGQYIYYVTNGGGAYYSSNSGVSFTLSSGTNTINDLASVTCSNSGEYVYIGGATGLDAFILFSNDYGVSFTTIFTTQNINFYSMCCDYTGNVVTACGPPTSGSNGSIYITSNGLSGTNSDWTLIPGSNSTSFTYWTAVTCDRNTGNKITMLAAKLASFFYLGGIWTCGV